MFDLNNRKFRLIENGQKGEVSGETIFLFYQDKNIVRADYFGGTIASGHILALINDDKMEMVYHCITIDNETKVGKASATIFVDDAKKINLLLNWKWISGADGKGSSHYIEVID